MVAQTDGLYMTHGLTESLALRFLEPFDCQALLRGHGGELAKTSLAWPFHTDATVHAARDEAAFRDYFFRRVGYLAAPGARQRVLRRPWSDDVEQRARASLDRTLDAAGLAPANACAYVYLHEHHRRYTVPSLQLFRSLFDVRLPFADEAFLEVLLGGDPRFRDDTTLHRRIVAAHSPGLMRVRNSNTGAPLWAGPLLESGLDKLNTVLKRLGVYGFRHYHAFDDWMRRMLLQSVREVLLDERTLDRGVIDRDGVTSVLDEMERGVADHAYLLQVLLIVELWQRRATDVAS